MNQARPFLYRQLAEDLQQSMLDDVLKPGQRLPSVRDWKKQRGLSSATILQAYALLERQGWIESRPRSGYYVRTQRVEAPLSNVSQTVSQSTEVDISDLVFRILGATRDQKLLPFGSAFPSPLLFPLKKLGLALSRSARTMDPWVSLSDLPPGSLRLRQEIARRYLLSGTRVAADEVLITNGALEALNLCLQAVTRPGDVVAIESPSFYGSLQSIERLHLRAVEVPTHPVHGVDPQSLRKIIDEHSVSACWFMSNFQNPLGASVPEANRKAIVELLAERDIPLVEDDVYSELHYGLASPKPFKHFDQNGLVLHCSSFSKCLAPGFRVGWASAGRYAEQVLRMKMTSSLATSTPAQEALADFLQQSGYELHLRRLRNALQAQQSRMLELIAEHFPPDTRASRADGGYFSWITLANGMDTMKLHRRCLSEHISLSPGPMFSARQSFSNCLRLNFGHPWTTEHEAGMKKLGTLASLR